MSETILCLIPSSLDGSFDKHALECLTAAEQLKSALSAQLVVGTWGSAQPDPSIGSIGASAYLHVDGDAFNQARYATDSAAAEAIAKQCGATVIIAPANSRIQRILSGVAQRMGGTVDTHATGIESESGKIIVSRWYYRQRMLAKLVRSARPCFVSVESGCFPVHKANGSCSFQKISVPAGSRTTVKDVLSSTGGDQTIRPMPNCFSSRVPVGPRNRRMEPSNTKKPKTSSSASSTKAKLRSEAANPWWISVRKDRKFSPSSPICTRLDRPVRLPVTPKGCPPAVTGKSPMPLDGDSCRNGGPSISTRIADGPMARQTCST